MKMSSAIPSIGQLWAPSFAIGNRRTVATSKFKLYKHCCQPPKSANLPGALEQHNSESWTKMNYFVIRLGPASDQLQKFKVLFACYELLLYMSLSFPYLIYFLFSSCSFAEWNLKLVKTKVSRIPRIKPKPEKLYRDRSLLNVKLISKVVTHLSIKFTSKVETPSVVVSLIASIFVFFCHNEASLDFRHHQAPKQLIQLTCSFSSKSTIYSLITSKKVSFLQNKSKKHCKIYFLVNEFSNCSCYMQNFKYCLTTEPLVHHHPSTTFRWVPLPSLLFLHWA